MYQLRAEGNEVQTKNDYVQEENEEVIPDVREEEEHTPYQANKENYGEDTHDMPKSILKPQSITNLIPPKDNNYEQAYKVKHKLPENKHVKFSIITSGSNELYTINNQSYNHIEPHTNITNYPCIENNGLAKDNDGNASDIQQPLRFFKLF